MVTHAEFQIKTLSPSIKFRGIIIHPSYALVFTLFAALSFQPTIIFRCFDGGFGHQSASKTTAKLKEIDGIMLATGLYKRIAILPGGTKMTPQTERAGLDAIYRRIK